MSEPIELGDDCFALQSPLWQTNTFVAFAAGEALVCDPALSPEEITHVRQHVDSRSPSRVHLLITHADFDHVCGIPSFPEAEVTCGDETAGRIETGVAAEGIRTQGTEWGMAWSEALRVDRRVHPGASSAGAFKLEVFDAPSHGREGVGYILLDQGILLPGDHLSAITYPLLGGPIERARAANQTLLDAIDQHDLRWVVPGHGPPLEPSAAREIGEADAAYLDGLGQAARDAVAQGLSPSWALLEAYAVEPPRATTDDFEIYAVRAGNAQKVIRELLERLG
jgi:glyoxylase-like metal-dependent hydrolase (beta-lactamase superfamily II)